MITLKHKQSFNKNTSIAKKEVFGFYGIPLNKQDNYQVHNAFSEGAFTFALFV